jgi:hypothetical protein
MDFMRRFVRVTSTLVLALAATASVHAQETPAPQATASPPVLSDHPTFMDRAYDGNTHVTFTPYVWLPTIRQNLAFTVPTLPHGGGGSFSSNTTVGPSDYLSKISSAAMFSFDVRHGEWDVFGDYIYTNVSSNATFASTLSGPVGKIHIPVTFTTNARLASSIWELAAGITLAHGHDADLNLFAGWRQAPINLTAAWNATIGTKGIIAPSGTVKLSPLANDVIFGFRGRSYIGDSHFYVPYYIDMGVGYNNQSYQWLSGAGYTFDHGQSLLLTYRMLSFNGFPPSSPIQKLNLYGPLLGYSFQL